MSGAQAPGQSKCNLTPEQEAASQAIAERIKNLGADIINTLQSVTANVSRYTGGALPENAGALVRRQLLSIPQRWQVAQQHEIEGSEATDSSEATRTGQRWIVFAEQGLDMITQVNIVLTGTVESAEKWLDSMGRKRRASASSSSTSTADHKHRGPLMSPPMTIHETNEKQQHGDYEMHMGTKL